MSGKEEIGARIAGRVRELRADRGYSLDALAGRSGVSRSAISMIERNETSPTAVVLEKLATGLGVPLASLFDAPGRGKQAEPDPVARAGDQPRWTDPASGYRRRNVSPPSWPSPIQLVEVEFPAGAQVSYDSVAKDVDIHQQLWVLSGQVEVTVGDAKHLLEKGDCLAMRLDQPTAFHNRTDRGARYAVILVSEPRTGRRSS
jgi:transcriptional regulator with XRE-family HTH domain